MHCKTEITTRSIINGSPPDWKEVVAVFAVKTAGTNDGVDVVTLDAEVETTGQEGEESKTILTITITARTIDEMREILFLYGSAEQYAG